MSPSLIITCFVLYSILLFSIVWVTSRKSNNSTFYLGNKSSPWYVVAYGMIGASLSGVTFMSVPGWVKDTQFSYLLVIIGYFFGYIVISTVLLPLYYRMNLTSIYSYLETRFGKYSYKSGSIFFIISRIIGASFRMFLVVNVIQTFVFDQWNIPFFFIVFAFLLLVLLFTYKGGIKTIVWTDTLQTTFMIISVITCIFLIKSDLNLSFTEIIDKAESAGYTKIMFNDWHDKRYFIKQLLSGMFISIVMTGLDQEMMQKNLSCRNIKDAQKNMISFSIVLIFVNFLFLFLGAILYIYTDMKGIEVIGTTDQTFPLVAFNYLGPIIGLSFLIGLISAAYPSADGALTSLTTVFCIDILGLNKNTKLTEQQKINKRYIVHIAFAILFLFVIVLYRYINDQAIVGKLFTMAGYTYGPLLGLYFTGLFTKINVKDKLVPLICITSPIICYILSENSEQLFNGYKFGFELLILNGFITFLGLLLIKKKRPN
ncbi:MAG: sodium:solute symporter [Bacteroidetes bacterium GWE2_29_8]|nr:MAG: sodium:solute symporter [Bacteroidetes bacterium GWE2_29_8]OFY18601.1 MAG: sodium:solute symporter [Bacteroidetes bacterium GWF2_29_10]